MKNTTAAYLDNLHSGWTECNLSRPELLAHLIRKFLPLYPESQIIDAFEYWVDVVFPELMDSTEELYKSEVVALRFFSSDEKRKESITANLKQLKEEAEEQMKLEEPYGFEIADLCKQGFLDAFIKLYLKELSPLYDESEDIIPAPAENANLNHLIEFYRLKLQIKMFELMQTEY